MQSQVMSIARPDRSDVGFHSTDWKPWGMTFDQ